MNFKMKKEQTTDERDEFVGKYFTNEDGRYYHVMRKSKNKDHYNVITFFLSNNNVWFDTSDIEHEVFIKSAKEITKQEFKEALEKVKQMCDKIISNGQG